MEIKINDIMVNYYEEGEGYPLIMIHGNLESGEYFEHQVAYFKDQYRCICPDSRAQGKTERGTAPMTIRQLVDDLIAFMDALEIEKANILGFSDGANIGMIMAMKYPERINKLIADGGNLDLGGVPAELCDYVMGEYKTAVDNGETVTAEVLNLMINDPNIDPEDLTKIACPTIVMAGTEDLITKEHTEMIASKIPGAQLAFVAGDHWCAGKNPTEFNPIIEKFLAE